MSPCPLAQGIESEVKRLYYSASGRAPLRFMHNGLMGA